MNPARPTHSALVRAAVDATGADRGWLLLLATDGGVATVVATAGPPETSAHVGTRRPLTGIAGLVAASGQPAAVQIRPGDTDNEGAGGATGTPRSILAAACGADRTLGVLELVDAVGGAFSFDDVELVSMIADIAGAALGEEDESEAPPSPAHLAAALSALAAADPTRYRDVARTVAILLIARHD